MFCYVNTVYLPQEFHLGVLLIRLLYCIIVVDTVL